MINGTYTELGALRITAEGVVKLAELASHAEDAEKRQKASEWLNHLLARAEESGGREAKEKLEALVEEGAEGIGQGNLWLYVVSILNKRGPLHG